MYKYHIVWERRGDAVIPHPDESEQSAFFDSFWACRFEGGIELDTLEGSALYESVTENKVAQNSGGDGPLGDLGVTGVVVVPRDETTFDAFYEVQE